MSMDGFVEEKKEESESTATGERFIRWGILSAGRISSDFCKAVALTEGAELAAVAARSGSRAKSFAIEHGIPKAYDNYEDLLKDPMIDVVYVGSIADQHASLATRSLLAGKPTVVEKPLTLTLRESIDLIQLAKEKDVFLMEGMWTRCFPAMRKVRELLQSNAIGEVCQIQGDFGWSTAGCPYPEDRIWHPRSGGMSLDIGMYMLQLGGIGYPGADVSKLQTMGQFRNGVDHTVLCNLQYGNSGFLQFFITGRSNTEERVVIQGTKGRIIVNPPAHVPTVLRLQTDEGRGEQSEKIFDFPLPDDSYTTWNYPGSIGFTYQVQAVGEALRYGERQCKHFTHTESLQTASIIDQMLKQLSE